MPAAGFLLAGGRSSRMGADKALLDFHGRSLLERVAGELAAVCSPVAIVGGNRGLPGLTLIADDVAGLGPAGGILTALRRSSGWNLIVAVDMPSVTRDLFAEILCVVESTTCDCVVPRSRDGPSPPSVRGLSRPLPSGLGRSRGCGSAESPRDHPARQGGRGASW